MSPPPPRRVCIIGAGASGLPAIRWTLAYDGCTPVCYEMSTAMGGLWRYKEYESTVMRSTVINTSKEMTAYSDAIPDEKYANFMHNAKLLEYFEDYARTHELEQYIKYRTKVLAVRRADDYEKSGKWDVTIKDMVTSEESTSTFDGVMVGTGHHALIHMVTFKGQELFTGRVLHSHSYKSQVGFENDRVVVVGVGNSGGDVAVELSRTARQVYLVTRRGCWVLNRVYDYGKPFDTVVTTRFVGWLKDTMPESIIERVVQGELNKRFSHAAFGLQAKHGVLDAHPTVNDELPNRIASGTLVVKPQIDCFTGPKSLRFVDGTEVHDIDTVIMCTGFSFSFPLLEESKLIPVDENKVRLYKNMYPPRLSHPSTLCVLGLVQPLGSVMPISEMQARVFMHFFAKDGHLPSSTAMEANIDADLDDQAKRYVKSRRHTIQRDYSTYMDEIAELIGCKPRIVDFWYDPRLMRVLLFGAQASYQYRLQGPHRWSGARDALLGLEGRVDCASRTRRLDGGSQSESILSPVVVAAILLLIVYLFVFTS